RVFLPSEQLQGNADTVAGLGIAGSACMRPLVDGDDLLELTQAQQAGRAHHQCRNVVRAQFQTRLEIAERVLQPPPLVEQGATLVSRVPMTGLEPEYVLEGQQSLIAPSLLLQRRSQAEEIFRPDILLQRARNPLHGVIGLAGVERQQPHQMQAAGVSGIDRERPLATELRLERTPGAPMPEAGLVERSRRIGVPAAGFCLGFSGCRPAFVTVHRGCLDETSASSSARTRTSTFS